MTSAFLNCSAVRRFCNERGRRISPEFLRLLDLHLRQKLTQSCAVHNGTRQTLDASVATFVGLTK
ncbi:MAG: hypothetical protein WCS42_08655 [Verrucomicrobiota bacterium]